MAIRVVNSSEIATSTDYHKACHLLGLLLTLGRPLRPPELASNSGLLAATPEFVEFLCDIPHSPLFLTSTYFVTVSRSALIDLGHFFSCSNLSILSFSPKFGIGDFGVFSSYCCGGVDGDRVLFRKRKRSVADFEVTYLRRRKLRRETDAVASCSPSKHAQIARHEGTNIPPNDSLISIGFGSHNKLRTSNTPSLNANANVRILHQGVKDIECVGVEEDSATMLHANARETNFYKSEPFRSNCHLVDVPVARKLHFEATLLADTSKAPARQNEAEISETSNEVNFHNILSLAEAEKSCNFHSIDVSVARKLHFGATLLSDASRSPARQNETEIDGTTSYISFLDALSLAEAGKINMLPLEIGNNGLAIEATNARGFKGMEESAETCEDRVTYPVVEQFPLEAKIQKYPPKINIVQNASTPRQQSFNKTFKSTKLNQASNEHQKRKRDHMSSLVKQKVRQSSKRDVDVKGTAESAVANLPKDKLEHKPFPNFESFIVEAEEGSGGYGTVYRAKKKSDGKMFAIKFPHANAHKNHVTNELKMLERFGGKNFIIKYEGSFKSENSDCLILEHVDHDRPEVLRKEIDVSQLQWYGYCIFRALASLHKQGIVHRDVKPGNFLFSRKVNKGYLIDFNLALDLHQKHGITNKSKADSDRSICHAPLAHTKPVSVGRRVTHAKFPGEVHTNAANVSKSTLERKNLKNRISDQAKVYKDSGSRNSVLSQGGEGSGITTAKDVTSTRTSSAERHREPVCWLGTRKVLNSLAQEGCQIPRHESINVSRRKRVAASPVNIDREAIYLTPMPLNLTGGVGGDLLKQKDDKKRKKDASCVGTKGFRAPEVLLKSQFQGPKVDVWSAGVTLLYLMTGRLPFVGEPEQNMKDIAKLRGSEDLWEIAKLHGRESSLPHDLFDTQWLPPSLKLREWSEENTKRPNLKIPNLLLDLVDKCLTVNPRVRISAEEALEHEFFTPCHEAFKMQRKKRQMERALASVK